MTPSHDTSRDTIVGYCRNCRGRVYRNTRGEEYHCYIYSRICNPCGGSSSWLDLVTFKDYYDECNTG